MRRDDLETGLRLCFSVPDSGKRRCFVSGGECHRCHLRVDAADPADPSAGMRWNSVDGVDGVDGEWARSHYPRLASRTIDWR